MLRSSTFALPLALALPSLSSIFIRQGTGLDPAVICGQFDSLTEGPFTLFNDQFGSGSAASGSQCAHVITLDAASNTVAWTTNWTWVSGASGGGVKSFANINLNDGVGIALSEISSVPTTWEWLYDITTTSVADVAYDLFTAADPSPSSPNLNEIMVWLANINAGPISATFSAAGQPVPVVSGVQLEGQTWDLFQGSNGANEVFSFLPSGGEKITSFSGDINAFLQFLVQNENLPDSQFLKTVQGGTEATSGTGTLTVSTFSIAVSS